MANQFLLKVADVLEQLGRKLDTIESEKIAAIQKTRLETVTQLSDKIAAFTGEGLDSDLIKKLAESPEEALTTVSNLIEKISSVESMGRSSDAPSREEPRTQSERTTAAWNNFGNYINS